MDPPWTSRRRRRRRSRKPVLLQVAAIGANLILNCMGGKKKNSTLSCECCEQKNERNITGRRLSNRLYTREQGTRGLFHFMGRSKAAAIVCFKKRKKVPVWQLATEYIIKRGRPPFGRERERLALLDVGGKKRVRSGARQGRDSAAGCRLYDAFLHVAARPPDSVHPCNISLVYDLKFVVVSSPPTRTTSCCCC